MKIENTDELRLLIECAHGGSLTAASKVLQITPAAASAMLKKLEARLGARLIERSTRALQLTPAGERLLDYAQRALDLLDEGLAQVSEATGQLSGRIRLSASNDLTRRLLLPLLDEFLDLHAGVELQLSVSDAVLDVVRDQVDVALRYGELADSGLVARQLTRTHRMAVASPDFIARHGRPASPAELVDFECITFKMRNRRELQWRFWPVDAPQAAPVVVRVKGRRSVDDGEITHRWALEGRGIVYKSELDIRASLASGALLCLFPDYLGDPFPLHAVMPSQRFMPQRVRALVDFLALRLGGG